MINVFWNTSPVDCVCVWMKCVCKTTRQGRLFVTFTINWQKLGFMKNLLLDTFFS